MTRMVGLSVVSLFVFGFLQAGSGARSHAGETVGHVASLEQQGLAILNARCTLCHSSDFITQQRLDRPTWNKVVDKMIKWGAPLSPDERGPLVEYLSAYYGTTVPAKAEEVKVP